MNLTQRMKLLKHFGSLPPEPKPPLLVVPKPGMEELTIWEQHTITLNKDPKLGFGFAISGGKDKPNPENGDTAVIVSDVLPSGPAMGRLFNKDQIVMVNGVSMENIHSNYTIQTLKTCGKTANITVKRPRKIQIPATTNKPSRAASHSNLLDYDPPRRTRRYSDGSDNRDHGRYRARSTSPERNGHGNTLPLLSSGYKRLPHNDFADKPLKTTLIKKKITDEYGLKLGSQIFIKHMTETGLASKEGTLQEGDLILKINGMTTENLSLLETKHLVEKSRGKLTMTVLRDDRKFLVTIPEVEDSPRNSEDDRRRESSSELEDISDIDNDVPPHRTSRPPNREKRTRRTRADPPPPAKSRDSSPMRSTLSRPAATTRTFASRRAPSESESDRSASPVRRDRVSSDSRDHRSKYKPLPGLSNLPNPRSSPTLQNWTAPRSSSSASRPRRPVSESDSDRSASPPPRRQSPRPDRYKVLPDLSHSSLRASPIPVRQDLPRRVNSPVRVTRPDSGSESDGVSSPPQRQSTSYSQDSLSRYRVLPAVSLQPEVEAPRWSTASTPPPKARSGSESEASYASVPRRDSTDDSPSADTPKSRYRFLPEKSSSVSVKKEIPPSPSRPPPDDSSESDELSHLRRSGSSERDHPPRRAPRPANGTGTGRSGISVKNNPPLYNKPTEEPIYSLPPDSYPSPNPGYSSDVRTVSFVKERSLGLRLVGGNDVGIFVGGVQPNSPAYEQRMKEGDQIMQVNKVDFAHFTREEAAKFLLDVKTGDKVEICTQNKMDLYKKITKSNLGDNFYVRTHFDHESDGPISLGFTRGEVFRVVDTMHRGKLGSWLAIRMGNDLHELDKGVIPNQDSAEKLASIEQAQRGTGSGERAVSGPRAEFWKLRGLRGNKKNEKGYRRTRDDLLQLTIQGKFPAYERVLLREANFKRPIVILGPLNDIAMEKLAREMPDEYEVAEMVPRSGGGDSSSTVIKLDTVRKIAEQDKHPLLDITPTAVERLNYIQYHPMVIFLDPQSRKDVKALRQRYNPDSNKSSRRLYSQALKMKKHCSHLFSARVGLESGSSAWYQRLKDKIRHQQSKPVWVSEITLESGGEQDLDTLDQTQTDYLSAASDLEDTDGEAFTDGEAYTDNEELEESYQEAARHPRNSRLTGVALARSSEPASGLHSLHLDPDARDEREVPPLMHVPEPRSLRRESYTNAEEEEEVPSQRSFTDSDFSALDAVAPTTPSDGPPDFRPPNPTSRFSVKEPSDDEEQPESSQPASLSVIEEKLQQTRSAEPQAQPEERKGPQFIVLAHHHQAVQFRRTQIRGSDSSEEEEEEDEEEAEDFEWGPATEL